jgi:hypothetical protein
MSALSEVIEQNECSLVFAAEWLDKEYRSIKHPKDMEYLKIEFLDGETLTLHKHQMPEAGLILRWSNDQGGEL